MSEKLPNHFREPTFVASDRDILSRYWHPVAYGSEVREKPVAAVLLDENLVVYRTTQGVVVAKDLCLHRGAALSLGWVENDLLVCGFHGFHYDSGGQCVRIPAHPQAAISTRLCLKIYPAIERYGLIWTCLAGDSQATLPEWPEMEDGSYEYIPIPAMNWKASAGRQTENFNDVSHPSWVHLGTFGDRDRPEISRYEVSAVDGRLETHLHDACMVHRDPSGKEADLAVTVHYHYTIDLPFSSRLLVDYKDGRHFYIYDVAAPVRAQESRVYTFMGRNFDHQIPPQDYVDYNMAVWREDQPFVESQCPEELPLDLQKEIHVPSDKMSVTYRQNLAALGLGKSFSS